MTLGGDLILTDEKRFCDNGDGTVTDKETNLMWSQTDAYQDTSKWSNWFMAEDYIKSLNIKKFAGYVNWRLPNIEEAETLLDEDVHIRNALAMNPSLPESILLELFNDEDTRVKLSVLSNSSCPKDILIKGSEDTENYASSRVRRAAALNKNAPKAIIDKLLKDLIDWISESIIVSIFVINIKEGFLINLLL